MMISLRLVLRAERAVLRNRHLPCAVEHVHDDLVVPIEARVGPTNQLGGVHAALAPVDPEEYRSRVALGDLVVRHPL
jgi:hypothetical protein